jgi:hypothetical protein
MKYIAKELSDTLVIDTIQRLCLSKDYNSDPIVRDNLRILYHGCCAYCECTPEAGSFYHIEHFYPKSERQYEKYRKSIENLHYSCQICNTLKNKRNPSDIMSPNYYLNGNNTWQITTENKIEDELYYVGHLLYFHNSHTGSIDRGRNTIDQLNLNNHISSLHSRSFLVECRIRCLADVTMNIRMIIEMLENYQNKYIQPVNILIKRLVEYTEGDSPFSTMIIHNYGKEIIKLIEIYQVLKINNSSFL